MFCFNWTIFNSLHVNTKYSTGSYKWWWFSSTLWLFKNVSRPHILYIHSLTTNLYTRATPSAIVSRLSYFLLNAMTELSIILSHALVRWQWGMSPCTQPATLVGCSLCNFSFRRQVATQNSRKISASTGKSRQWSKWVHKWNGHITHKKPGFSLVPDIWLRHGNSLVGCCTATIIKDS